MSETSTTEKMTLSEVHQWLTTDPMVRLRYSVAATRLEVVVPSSQVRAENGIVIESKKDRLALFIHIDRAARFWVLGNDLAISNDGTGETFSFSRLRD